LTSFASILALLFFALLFLTSFHPDYGHYADEFNYIACAERPDLGYVDHPPLAPLILAINRAVLGDSLPALRLLPALCGALTVLLAAWMARRLGGAAFAQLLAAVCVTTAPLYMSPKGQRPSDDLETVGREEGEEAHWLATELSDCHRQGPAAQPRRGLAGAADLLRTQTTSARQSASIGRECPQLSGHAQARSSLSPHSLLVGSPE
jgi:hypothetical protein